MTCAVLVADPPWRFGDKLPGPGRGAEKHYPTMSTAEICAFQLPMFADAATLFLWRVAAMQHEALAVIGAWGFTLKSEIVWRKLTKNGKRAFGMGHRVRMEHEVCLIATRGRPKVADRGVRSVFDADEPEVPSIFEAQLGEHSAKPDAFYEIVERLHPNPTPETHVELFARRERASWSCYGNELAMHAPAPF